MQDIILFITEHIILISIWLFFLILTAVFMTKNIFLKSKFVNNFQAIKLINQDKAIIIDTRSIELFQQGHIINSINIPLKDIFLGKLQEVEIYKSFPIILVLNETYKNDKCLKEFLKYGFKHIYILKYGIYYWNLDHLPLVTKNE